MSVNDTGHRLDCSTNHGGANLQWCEHIEDYIKSGADSEHVLPKGDAQRTSVVVPLFPTSVFESYMEVIVAKSGWPGIYAAHLTHQRDMGGHFDVDLPFLAEGEGRRALRSGIIAYMEEQIDYRDMPRWRGDHKDYLFPDGTANGGAGMYTRCNSTVHSITGEKRRQKLASEVNTTYWINCLYNIIFEGACTECLNYATNGSGGNWSPDPADFGIDPSATNSGRRPR